MAKRRRAPRSQVFHSKIAGVTHRNPDGSRRQKLLKRCRVNDPLTLLREPRNRHDRNAVAVFRWGTNEQLGYITAAAAETVAAAMDAGVPVGAWVTQLTGGGWIFRRTRGANIVLRIGSGD